MPSPALEVKIETNVYAVSEHGHDNLPWPMPADTWLWQSGDRWVAHVGAWYADSWWDGASDEDLAARPEDWQRHILDVPDTGTLVYLDNAGNEVERKADELPEHVLRLEQVKIQREQLWIRLQAQGGRGVDLAEQIDELDGLIERLESGEGTVHPDQATLDDEGDSELFPTEEEVAVFIRRMSPSARELVMDCLRVRAMDFVQDRLRHNDGAADMAADIYRAIDPGADGNNAFDPDNYGRES